MLTSKIQKAFCIRFMSAILFLCAFPLPNQSRAAILPPYFLDNVVALGGDQCSQDAAGATHCVWFTEGTAFEYGYLLINDPDPAKRRYLTFLVTAKHVVEGHSGTMHVRLNPTVSGVAGREYDIPAQSENGPWFFHPDPKVDLAIIPVASDQLQTDKMLFNMLPSDLATADSDKMRELGISAGDGAFVLGFPMNLAGAQRNYVIVRQAVIARVSEMLDHVSKTFLIDALVFPGNSGGPVFSKPEIIAISGTKSQSNSYLIGVVLAYEPYVDVALSAQTKRPRVTFEENSGLAEVLPVDYIEQAVVSWIAKHPVNSSRANPSKH